MRLESYACLAINQRQKLAELQVGEYVSRTALPVEMQLWQVVPWMSLVLPLDSALPKKLNKPLPDVPEGLDNGSTFITGMLLVLRPASSSADY